MGTLSKLNIAICRAKQSIGHLIIGDKNDSRFPWIAGSALYLVAFGVQLFFLRSYFWDDWAIYPAQPKKVTLDFFTSTGFGPIQGLIQVGLFQRSPVFIHLASFVLFFIGGYLLFKILRTIEYLCLRQTRLITLFFLVLPINSARVSMITFNYSYSLIFFFLGWYLLTCHKKRLIRLSASLFFLASFSTLSLLPFFFLPVTHLYIQIRKQVVDKRALAVSFGFALFAPAYWLVSRTLIQPSSEDRLNYLTPTFSGICRAFLLMTVLLIGVMISFQKRHDTVENARTRMLWVGAFIVGCGAFAYISSGRLVDTSEWMLNFVPRSSDWDSRHQLLLGLGISVFFVGLLGPVETAFKRSVVIVSLLMCVSLNLIYMQSYYLDSLKQKETLELFGSSSKIKESNVIMIDDQAKLFNARGRGIRSYEWEGMLRTLFGDENIKVIYTTYIDCGVPGTIIPDTRAVISATNGRLRALLTRKIGLQISVEKISPCA